MEFEDKNPLQSCITRLFYTISSVQITYFFHKENLKLALSLKK